MPNRWFVYGCNNPQGHAFPGDPTLRKQWIQLVKREKTFEPTKWQRVWCGEAWKKEWRYRRDVYVKKRRQLHDEQKLAAAGDSPHPAAKVPNWKFYQPMAFLDQFVASNSAESESNFPSYYPEEAADASTWDDSANVDSSPVSLQDDKTDVKSGGKTTPGFRSKILTSNNNNKSTANRHQPFATKQRWRHQLTLTRRTDHQAPVTPLPKDRAESGHRALVSDSESRCGRRSASQSFCDHCVARMEVLPSDIQSCLQIQIMQLLHNAENPAAPPVPVMPLPVHGQSQPTRPEI